jgi:putative transcriptional regulator
MTDRPDDGDAADGQDEAEAIVIRLDEVLSERQMTLTELSARVGVTIVNLSVLKNGRARAIRFSTLARLCRALDCQPGDLLRYHADQPVRRAPPEGTAAR